MTWYVVDGMDGSGKSTAAAILREELESEGRTVLAIEHPNAATVVGRMEQAFLRKGGELCVILSTIMYVADVLRSLTVMRGRRGRSVDDVVFVRYSMAAGTSPGKSPRNIHRITRAAASSPATAAKRCFTREAGRQARLRSHSAPASSGRAARQATGGMWANGMEKTFLS